MLWYRAGKKAKKRCYDGCIVKCQNKERRTYQQVFIIITRASAARRDDNIQTPNLNISNMNHTVLTMLNSSLPLHYYISWETGALTTCAHQLYNKCQYIHTYSLDAYRLTNCKKSLIHNLVRYYGAVPPQNKMQSTTLHWINLFKW